MRLEQLGAESIYHQFDNTFGKELEEAIDILRTYIFITSSRIQEVDIAGIIKRNTGLTVKVELGGEQPVELQFPLFDKNNVVLSTKLYKKLTKKDTAILKTKKIIQGTVNIANATVSGDFCNISGILNINTSSIGMGSQFSTQEAVALIIKEVGRFFTFFELLTRVSKTNYLLTAVLERLVKARRPEDRIQLLTDVENLTNNKIAFKEQIANKERNLATLSVVLLTADIKGNMQDLELDIYSERGFEQLSDNFTARMGYAVPLATSMKKVDYFTKENKKINKYYYKSPIFIILKNLFIFRFMSIIVLYGTSLALTLLFSYFVFRGITRYTIIDKDTPKQRITKLKNQINDALKDEDLSTAQREQLIINHAEIIKVLDQVNDYMDVTQMLWSFITPMGRQERNIITEQNELEALSNNDLFTGSFKLLNGVS